MNAIDLSLLNFKETRRRSLKLWSSLPNRWINWRPDEEAMSFGEMIRHVWSATHQYQMILENNGSIKTAIHSSYDQEPILSVEQEIHLSFSYFDEFLEFVRSISPEQLDVIQINRADVGYERYLGDMLMRIAYHEAVHAGQFLHYLRTAKLERPLIWD